MHVLAALTLISLCAELGDGVGKSGLPAAGTVSLVMDTGSLDNHVAFFRGLVVSDSDFLSLVSIPWLSPSCGMQRWIGLMVGGNVLSAWVLCLSRSTTDLVN